MNVDFAGLALRANPDALIIVGTTGIVQYWDASAERLFGQSASAAVGQPLRLLLVPPAEHDAFRALLARACFDGSAMYECVYPHTDGSRRHFDVTVCAIAPMGRMSEHLLFAFKDVTALKLAAQSHSLTGAYGELLDTLPDGVLLVAPSGLIAHANARALEMFGYAAGELNGCPVESLLPSRHRAAHVARRDAFFGRESHAAVTNVDIYGQRKNGSEFPIEVRLSACVTPQGRVAVAAVRDVTERKRSELVLTSRILELEARLRAATSSEA